MPNFSVQVEGAELAEWSDRPETSSEYERLNPLPGRPHTFYSVMSGTEVVLRAVVPGLGVAPADSLLGTETFVSHLAEHPVPYLLVPQSPAGRSSECRFTAAREGHYLVVMRRSGGGAVGIHLDTWRLVL
jgi:hypothetical protein